MSSFFLSYSTGTTWAFLRATVLGVIGDPFLYDSLQSRMLRAAYEEQQMPLAAIPLLEANNKYRILFIIVS